jgi:hypothetical protein
MPAIYGYRIHTGGLMSYGRYRILPRCLYIGAVLKGVKPVIFRWSN